MKQYADIFINIPVKSVAQSYTYIIPEKFHFLQPGCRVVVPFGAREMEGFIVRVFSAQTSAQPLKEITGIIDTEAYFTKKVMQTAHFIADFYLCSLGEALRLFIPGKNSIKLHSTYKIIPNPAIQLSETEQKIYDFIKANPGCDLLAIKAAVQEDVLSLLDTLPLKKVIERSYDYKRRSQKIYETYVQISDDITADTLTKLTRKRTQKAALKFLSDHKIHSLQELAEHKFSHAIIKILAEEKYINLIKKQVFRDSYKQMTAVQQPGNTLTAEQKNALAQILPYLQQQKEHVFLLHGVTGSGKTRLYIEAAKYVLAAKRQALILVPEIVLTGQLVLSFKEFFSDDVVVIHSRLTVSERSDAFARIRMNQTKIIIGARSAIFAPFDDLGLIVMDEEHDASYKQDESPRYHTRDIARRMAQLYHAVLILGSATPSMESYYNAKHGIYTLLQMPHRVDNKPMPSIKSADMREELRCGNRHIISRDLQALISRTLEQKQQVIIMLNRRGYSTFVMCRSCGFVVKCPQCGLPLVYHRGNYMQCHHCDIREPVPDICPACHSRYIKFFGSGTEKLEQQLQESFPQARTIRLDRDTTSKKFAHQKILREFKKGNYDILLGTQMVAKGHDIPSVTAVGIISADSSLNMPDFRAAERCFSLITQTAGRAGRGSVKGEVIVQGYNTEHYAVTCGLAQDYESFYEKELKQRKELFYPPFTQLVKLTVQQEKEETALKQALKLRKVLLEKLSDSSKYRLMGPAPSVIANFRGLYRFNLLIKTTDLKFVNTFLRELELDVNKTVKIDVNPLNTM